MHIHLIMKKFILCILFAGIINYAASQNDADSRLVDFLNATLPKLSTWMRENGHVPDDIPGGGKFTFNGTNLGGVPFYELNGEIKNRFFHGAENNIESTRVESNLTSLSFRMDFSYGAKSNFVTGEYEIEGSIISLIPVYGKGNFTRSGLTTALNLEQSCRLEVLPEGYFALTFCGSQEPIPKFTEFDLEDLDSGGNGSEMRITALVNAWYEMQIPDYSDISSHYYDYMSEVFQNTPIVDIIGENLPPSTTARGAEKSIEKRSEIKFDVGKKQWLQETLIGRKA